MVHRRGEKSEQSKWKDYDRVDAAPVSASDGNGLYFALEGMVGGVLAPGIPILGTVR